MTERYLYVVQWDMIDGKRVVHAARNMTDAVRVAQRAVDTKQLNVHIEITVKPTMPEPTPPDQQSERKRTCRECGKALNVSHFYRTITGYRPVCDQCHVDMTYRDLWWKKLRVQGIGVGVERVARMKRQIQILEELISECRNQSN